MQNRWLVTPWYFEQLEPALATAAPPEAALNDPGEVADRSPASLARLHRPIADFVAEAALAGARPVSVAGDCCAAVPVLAGLQRAGIAPTLVWVDAHGDFNTPETSPSQFLGGMPLAMMVGRGPQWMCENVGGARIPEARVWLADGRDLDPEERAALDASAVRRCTVAELATIAIDGPVWVHADLDVIDARDAPAMNYPVRGGPSAEQVADAFAALRARVDLAAVSVCGWTSRLDADGRTGAACRRAVRALAGD